MKEFLNSISLANLPAESADYLDQLAIWSRLASEAEEAWDIDDPNEVQNLYSLNMHAARARCIFMLEHLNNKAVLELLAHLIRDAQRSAG